MSDPTPDHCPCGSGKAQAECCGRFLNAGESPETAEELMRSRYSAYCLNRIDYLVETTHPKARNQSLRRGYAATADAYRWTSLQIVSTSQGQARDKAGKVEFIAGYEHAGESGSHHERSRFRRFEGRWMYLDDQG